MRIRILQTKVGTGTVRYLTDQSSSSIDGGLDSLAKVSLSTDSSSVSDPGTFSGIRPAPDFFYG